MIRFIPAVVLLLTLLFALAGTSRAAEPQRLLPGEYPIEYQLIGGGPWPHVYTIDFVDPATGEFSGTGRFIPDRAYAEIITGRFDGSVITFHVLYTGFNAGYTVDAVGRVDANGQLFGTAVSPGQLFTWTCSRAFPAPDPAPPGEPWFDTLMDSLWDSLRQLPWPDSLQLPYPS